MLANLQTSERRAEIVAAARELLEADGPDAVTMRAIAGKLGIRAPSLYKHVPDKDDLETALVADAFAEVAGVFARAVQVAASRKGDALTAIAVAYRGWANDHAHLYRLMTAKPIDREHLPAGLEDAAAAPLVEACGGDSDRARAAWAFAHGMVSLELAGRFPPDADLDGAWRSGIDAFRPARPHTAAQRRTKGRR